MNLLPDLWRDIITHYRFVFNSSLGLWDLIPVFTNIIFKFTNITYQFIKGLVRSRYRILGIRKPLPPYAQQASITPLEPTGFQTNI